MWPAACVIMILQEQDEEFFFHAVLSLMHELFVAYRDQLFPFFDAVCGVFAGMLVCSGLLLAILQDEFFR